VANAVRDMATRGLGLGPAARRKALLDFIFAGARFQSLRDVVVIAELTSLAGRDEGVDALLSRMWEAQIDAIARELVACFPNAPDSDRTAVAYALCCLGEQHWWLTFIGPAKKRGRAARRADPAWRSGSLISLAECRSPFPKAPASTRRRRQRRRRGSRSPDFGSSGKMN
jgi:hypothetical protein